MMTHSPPISLNSERLRVRGLVQGVGFRPTVFRIASELGLAGEVYNDGAGVVIDLAASASLIDCFIHQLQAQCPPLARIDGIERASFDGHIEHRGFRIKTSESNTISTGVIADAATCPACLDDIVDPANRRHGYAFTNCTHCGPRISIVRGIPYDRASTSMAVFPMCPECQREYDDPADRRFHAQPNACPVCGPRLWLTDNRGETIEAPDVIEATARAIEAGQIVAIKGIGGFQLACDAGNDEAIMTLRRRKQRPHKSLALMARDSGQVAVHCRVDDSERRLLESHQAPIVVLQRLDAKTRLSEHIAPGQDNLGFMLPYSPLHHLLMRELERPIVLTSGNRSEEPQCIDNEQALQQLGDIADVFVMHDRAIVNRIDDSVVRCHRDQPQFYRRARGYAPAPLALPPGFDNSPPLLACGGEMKNTFALLKHGQVTLSQHLGNLENALTHADYLKNLGLYTRLYEFEPAAVVVDRHPGYLSSQHGERLAAERGLALFSVQHHHAHVAACLADNGWPLDGGEVLGVALDGLGLGDDGSIWGGEFLRADYSGYSRLARFKPAPMPGATQAILEPWRNTYAQLRTHCDWHDLNQHFGELELLKYLNRQPLQVMDRMLDKHLNSPLTSSCGRLFDAAAAALGLARERISHEGQAAMMLEASIDRAVLAKSNSYPLQLEHGALIDINPQPMWHGLLQDLKMGHSTATIAARFHRFVAQAVATTLHQLREQTGLDHVALCGGVFQNMTLLQLVDEQLRKDGFTVLMHHQVPANDGGLSLGQVAIAAAQLQGGITS